MATSSRSGELKGGEEPNITDRQRTARFSSAECLLRTTLQRIDEFRDLLGGCIPMRVLETQEKGKNRRDCMRQFKAAWEWFAGGQPG
jgi:hypothetical protein